MILHRGTGGIVTGRVVTVQGVWVQTASVVEFCIALDVLSVYVDYQSVCLFRKCIILFGNNLEILYFNNEGII